MNAILSLCKTYFGKTITDIIIEMIFQDGGSRTCSQYNQQIYAHTTQNDTWYIINQIAWMNFSACHYTAKLVTISKKECIFFPCNSIYLLWAPPWLNYLQTLNNKYFLIITDCANKYRVRKLFENKGKTFLLWFIHQPPLLISVLRD